MSDGDRGYGPVFAAAPDATGGALTLDVRDPRAVHAPVVDLVETVDVLADALDIPWRGTLRHGFCWGLLVPEGDGAAVVVMGRTPADLEGPGVRVGRIVDGDARRFLQLWAGRAARVSLLVEATPGSFALEVRYRSVPADPPALALPHPAEPSAPTAPVAEPSETDTPTWAAATAAAATAAAVADSAAEPEPEIVAVAEPEPVWTAEPEPEIVAVVEPEPAWTAEPAWTSEPEPEPEIVAVVEAEPEPEPEPAWAAADEVAAATWAARAMEEAPASGVEPELSPVATDPALLAHPGVPAGWYVDPFDADELRWWDGTRWSIDAAPRPAARHDEV